MLMSQAPQLAGVQPAIGPGAPAYVGQPNASQQQAPGNGVATSPLIAALLGAQAGGGPAQQQQSSPLGGLPLGALAQMFGQQGGAGAAGPSYSGATGPFGFNTPGALPAGGGAAQYP